MERNAVPGKLNPKMLQPPQPQPNQEQQEQQQQWWNGIAAARARIDALSHILDLPLDPLLTSDTPARDLLHHPATADAIISALSSPTSGRADDPLCCWLYDTLHIPDSPDLLTLVLRFLPALCNAYLPRPSAPGFEAILLSLYSSELRSRHGKPLLVTIPNLAHPSLYHTPRTPGSTPGSTPVVVGQLSPPLEPQEAVKTSKRAAVVGVALEVYHRRIAAMPARSKLEFCTAVRHWAVRGCSWAERVDEVAKLALLQAIAPGPDPTLTGHVSTVGPSSSTSIFVPAGSREEEDEEEQEVRIPLPWELLQPILKILGHCLMGPSSDSEVKSAAAAAARALYARATHELIPEAILPTRALLRLDEAARSAAVASATAAAVAASANATPSKPRKPEILLTPPGK